MSAGNGARLRVLYLSAAHFVGGAERSLLGLVRALRPLGVEALVALPQEGAYAAELREAGIAVRVLEVPSPYLTRLWRRRATRRRILGLIEEWRPDLLHVNSVPWVRPAARAAAATGLPWIAHVRDRLDSRSIRGWRAPAWRAASAILAISRFVAEPFGTDPRVLIVANGVDAALFDPEAPGLRERRAALRAAWGLPGDAFLLGAVGYLIPRKGLETLVDAAALAAPASPGLRWAIVGEDPFPATGYGDALRARAAAGRVLFPGFVKDAPGLYAALDALVMAAPDEPFGRTMIEAMAAGRPVLAARGGAAPELLEGGELGLLVEPGDAAGLAGAATRLAGDAALRERLVRAGLERARERYAWDAAARAVLAVYRVVFLRRPTLPCA